MLQFGHFDQPDLFRFRDEIEPEVVLFVDRFDVTLDCATNLTTPGRVRTVNYGVRHVLRRASQDRLSSTSEVEVRDANHHSKPPIPELNLFGTIIKRYCIVNLWT